MAYQRLKEQLPTEFFFQAGPSMRIAYYLIAKERLDDALTYLEFMLDEFENSGLMGYIYDALGDCHQKLGNTKEATEWTQRAIERNPEFDHAKTRLEELGS